jgi:hypothetical protein
MSQLPVVVVLAGVASGCASLEITHTNDSNADGLHFYRPSPYIAVSTGDKGCQVSMLFLPNPDQEYVVKAHSGLGTVSFKPTLADGWNLTGLDSTVDSKANELLKNAAAFVPGVKGGAEAGVPEPPFTCPVGLYRLKMSCLKADAAGGGKLEGNPCLTSIFKEIVAVVPKGPAAPPAGK